VYITSERGHMTDLDVDGKIILKLIINRELRCGFHSSGLGQDPVACSCERGNEPSASIKGGEFLD